MSVPTFPLSKLFEVLNKQDYGGGNKLHFLKNFAEDLLATGLSSSEELYPILLCHGVIITARCFHCKDDMNVSRSLFCSERCQNCYERKELCNFCRAAKLRSQTGA
jgi:hypothetical protein